jgi:hypothetical protein
MFRLTIWSKTYELVGTIERRSLGTLLDMGSRLQKDYGAVYKVEHLDGGICTECGQVCRECTT